jgi:hypothetical protein
LARISTIKITDIMLQNKKINISTLLAILGAVVLRALVVYIAEQRKFDPFIDVQKWISGPDKQFKVGIIGDSWVAGKKLDKPVQEALSKRGIEAVIVSFGHPSANSRQVYRDLFLRRWTRHHILMDDEIDYLVVVAGVNDTAGHIGKDFYAHHMMAIAKVAVDRSISPILIEVPEYEIEQTPAASVASWAKRLLFRILYDRGKVNVIKDYRRQLRSSIAASPDGNKITVLDFSAVATDYTAQKNLYANPSHLNDKGNKLLGEAIAAKIAELHRRRF